MDGGVGMSKVNAHADAVLDLVTTPYVVLLTACGDVNDPTTWTEASYAGYARIAQTWGTKSTVSGKRQHTGPTSDMLFTAIPSGSVSVVAWAICDHLTNALSSSAKRCIDAPFTAKVYGVGDQPKIVANAITQTER